MVLYAIARHLKDNSCQVYKHILIIIEYIIIEVIETQSIYLLCCFLIYRKLIPTLGAVPQETVFFCAVLSLIVHAVR